ncbi:H-NS histone family protein (plasmid) [Burkholderia thailandensis 34]|uniref:H-NS histone family protein n=1 Tax=Burkholderia thailandensis TaxID=57975 RepID=UPI0005F1DCCD|nr:H-NS histone family protein [Burkholderia thailandensis]AJY27051.1 H-NS histone family protein [Burkholderia thailandensis 34]AOJ58504.1 hypothetical protein AQ477_17865 [Burkholderia thailandensis]KXF59800.1 hypothetical protein AQ476_18460 [Burkholderia thailandensis]PNE73151.1 H-NS histone [Burkholderia thailandensis]
MSRYQMLFDQYEKLKQQIDRERKEEMDSFVCAIANRIREILDEYGLDIEVVPRGIGPEKTRKKIEPKYWNKKTGQTWSGRGRTPLWLVGQDREKFRIPIENEDQDLK